MKGEYKSKIRKNLKDAWLRAWEATTPTENKLREITANFTPLPNTSSPDRRWERTLARLRVGHSPLTHGFLMTANAERPICDQCDDEEILTIKHILTVCPAYRAGRLRAFGRTTVSMRDLLNTGDTSHGSSLFRFLQDINLLSQI